MEDRIILLKYGELALKGNNRRFFEKALLDNIKITLSGMNFRLRHNSGRIYVQDVDQSMIPQYIDRLRKVFGLVGVSEAHLTELNMESIFKSADSFVKEHIKEGRVRFKVESRRANKGFPLSSPQLSAELGGMLLEANSELSVDVNNPDFIIYAEIRDKAYVYSSSIKAQGGMPYRTNGKGALLLSGGIDSPVAGYMMAKRGMEIIGVHFHSFPFTSEQSKDKVLELARKLTQYTGRMKVYLVNLLDIQTEITEKCNAEFSTILQRRFMTEITQRIAENEGAKALITGESLGQVASQTLEGINATNNVAHLPIFRPLIGFDKVDIIKIAREIDTFETSIQPFEDCCTVFLPDRVATKPNLKSVLKNEALLDKELLIEKAMETMEYVIIKRES